MTLITIQDSSINPLFAEILKNDFPAQSGFRATKAKIKKDAVTLVQLSDDAQFVDVYYGKDVISLSPNAITSINGETNTGWTGEDLYNKICTYLNI